MTRQDLAIRQVPQKQERSLEALVEVVRSEHEMVLTSLASAIQHAYRVGEALEAARPLVTHQGFVEWLVGTFDFKLSAGYNYMRIYKHWDLIQTEGYLSLTDAVRGISKKGQVRYPKHIGPGRGYRKFDATIEAQIKEMHQAGRSLTSIGKTFNCTWLTVVRAIDPDKAREHEKRANARSRERRAAWRKQQRDALARNAGGDISMVYSTIRELAEKLDSAISGEADKEARGELNSALLKVYKVEDHIVKALRMHRGRAEEAA